ncbi:MAG: TIGR04255 family protein [Mycobacterium sp.]|uniref:TIGR04255 family protein n=1 Tax=Mycobacterium sp. TaxID=1785 RepID=UPI001EB2089B|nr:TIGR04255 family protein [Mycobacterium sp.]MBW0019099.1 TIGR04255 family protein [Mycobacterium sp.]
MAAAAHPFAFAESDTNIPLVRAPLVRTIAQVRFPHLTRFSTNEDAVGKKVADALADQYPLMEIGQEVTMTITADGVSEDRSTTRLFRLLSGDRHWQITFCGSFLSIDTTQYVRRRDFAQRLVDAWKALNGHVAVPYISRLGVRYVNQLTQPDLLGRLPELLRPEVLGISKSQHEEEAELLSAVTEARYRLPGEASFMARWGMLPAGTTLDSSVPTYDYPTWMLDTDSFREFAPGTQQGGDLYEDVRDLALRGYQFFRWAVTEEFLIAFGGEV